MKIPFRRNRVRDALEGFARSLETDLKDPTSEVRKLFARVARGESRDFFALHIGTELEKFERELAARAERMLSELGSGAQRASNGQLDREVRRALTVLERDHRKVLFALPADQVCFNSACSTGEVVPHMRDERDHRSYGEVMAEERGECNDRPASAPLACALPAGHTGRHKRGEREWDPPQALPTCTPDKPCNLPGHNGVIDPTLSTNVLDMCPNTRFTIPNGDANQ